MNKCQSCKKNLVEVIDSSDNESFPYELCLICQKRLEKYALRPLEYFNLAAIHGHKFLLHDDFYEDNGEATQSEENVDEDNNLRFPYFNEVQIDLEKLLDWSIVKWWIDKQAICELRTFDKVEVLTSLQRRLNKDRTITARIYEITAEVLGKYAEKWILSEWENKHDDIEIYAHCLSKCTNNGFDLYVDELEKSTSFKDLNEKVIGLLYFQSNKSLQWIQQNSHKIENITSNWSMVAVASQFDWQTCKLWLEKGRILSLIALDTLIHCAVDKNTMNSSIWLRENPQKLHNPDSIEIMSKVVNDYVKIDNVPRTRRCNEHIQSMWAKIIEDKNSEFDNI
jgi:hypothetical protein